jgi:predicted aldo/keto reductase-like oxidoreductase
MAGVGAMLVPEASFAQQEPGTEFPKVTGYRTLGRTGFKVSDIGVGTSQVYPSAIMGTVLDAGVNYIDTAEGYGRGNAEKSAGEAILAAYKEHCGRLYCRHACGLCEPSCPSHVPVNTIMRYNHYFEAQGSEKFAMEKYARLNAPKADRCRDCTGFCQTACPYGVPIQGLLNIAHARLTLA